jgi:hypothetical protein
MWSVLRNVLCVFKKNVPSSVLGYKAMILLTNVIQADGFVVVVFCLFWWVRV